ncbi:MAG TPA: pilus assembly PilX N-terminal domain-containing protein [Nitrospiria bacterium]|nr:pilus assembly PilX N-terminal domain-containing protein [Nitrospiria bacterium]
MNTRTDEHGVALVLALWMLVILGLVGTLLLSSSNVEMRLAANNRNMRTALYTSDAAVQYAKSDSTIYTTIGSGAGAFPAGATPGTYTLNNVPIGANSAQRINVAYLTVGPPPPGSGIDASKYQTVYFSAQAVGVGPNNSQALVEVQIAKPILK